MKKVLIVEDDYLNMELIKLLLDDMGLYYDEVENGEDAVIKCEKYSYSLILMDIMLPGIDGIEVTKKVKNIPANKDVPVIAITAMKGDRKKYISLGFDDHIPKPIDVDRFTDLIRKYKQ